MAKKRPQRSDRLLKTLAELTPPEVYIVAHDNPDPDAIAAGWGLCELIQAKLSISTRLLAGGGISRAENIQMVRLLEPPLLLVDDWQFSNDDVVVLIDCHPHSANHLLYDQGHKPTAVIDHHINGKSTERWGYQDLRSKVAASATMVGQYLREQNVSPSERLATALLFALRSDTHSAQANFSPADKRMATWLTAKANLEMLAHIEHAPLPRTYFAEMLLALESTFLYGQAALCFLPQATGPEIVGEVADLLIRCEAIDRVFCGSVVDENIMVSVRTNQQGGDANRLIRKTLKGLGRGGGHRHRAGGKIPAKHQQGQVSDNLQTEIRNRWLDACRVENTRGTRLVPPREIINNL